MSFSKKVALKDQHILLLHIALWDERDIFLLLSCFYIADSNGYNDVFRRSSPIKIGVERAY